MEAETTSPAGAGRAELAAIVRDCLRIFRGTWKTLALVSGVALVWGPLLYFAVGGLGSALALLGGDPEAATVAASAAADNSLSFALVELLILWPIAGTASTMLAVSWVKGSELSAWAAIERSLPLLWRLIGGSLLYFVGVLGLGAVQLLGLFLVAVAYGVGLGGPHHAASAGSSILVVVTLSAIFGSMAWLSVHFPVRGRWLTRFLVRRGALSAVSERGRRRMHGMFGLWFFPGAPLVYFAVLWCLWGQAMVLEGRGPRGALARSEQLVRDAWLSVAGAVALASLLSVLASYAGMLLALLPLWLLGLSGLNPFDASPGVMLASRTGGVLGSALSCGLTYVVLVAGFLRREMTIDWSG